MTTTPASSPSHVLIAGGGIAGLEALIALRVLAGDRVALTLLAPEETFTYRPLATARPFALGRPTRHPLAAVARDFGATLVRDRVVEVAPERRRVRGESGAEHAYDALVIAVGARTIPVPHAITFGEDPTDELLHGLLTDLEAGYVRGVAFVAPPGTSWSLPLYELALLTARPAPASTAERAVSSASS
jgi:sulfide:quinone oxidoreductase